MTTYEKMASLLDSLPQTTRLHMDCSPQVMLTLRELDINPKAKIDPDLWRALDQIRMTMPVAMMFGGIDVFVKDDFAPDRWIIWSDNRILIQGGQPNE